MKSTPNIPEPITKDFIKQNQKLPGFEDISKPEGIIELSSCKQNLYQTNDYIMSETPSDIKIFNKNNNNNNMDIIDIEDEDKNIIINRDDSSDSDNDNDAYTL